MATEQRHSPIRCGSLRIFLGTIPQQAARMRADRREEIIRAISLVVRKIISGLRLASGEAPKDEISGSPELMRIGLTYSECASIASGDLVVNLIGESVHFDFFDNSPNDPDHDPFSPTPSGKPLNSKSTPSEFVRAVDRTIQQDLLPVGGRVLNIIPIIPTISRTVSGGDAHDDTGNDTIMGTNVTAAITLSFAPVQNLDKAETDTMTCFENATAQTFCGVTGTSATNVLEGLASNDILNALDRNSIAVEGADDTLTGGPSNVIFVVAPYGSSNVVNEFAARCGSGTTIDLNCLAGLSSFGAFMPAPQLGNDALIDFNSDRLQVQSVSPGALISENFVFVRNWAPTVSNLSKDSVAENAAAGTGMGSLAAIDPDAGDKLSFTIINGSDQVFSIVGSDLIGSGAPDYVIAASHEVAMRAADSVISTIGQQFTITITDVNDAPIDIELLNDTALETVSIATVVGLMLPQDLDANDIVARCSVNGTGDFVKENSPEGAEVQIAIGLTYSVIMQLISGRLLAIRIEGVPFPSPLFGPLKIEISLASPATNASVLGVRYSQRSINSNDASIYLPLLDTGIQMALSGAMFSAVDECNKGAGSLSAFRLDKHRKEGNSRNALCDGGHRLFSCSALLHDWARHRVRIFDIHASNSVGKIEAIILRHTEHPMLSLMLNALGLIELADYGVRELVWLADTRALAWRSAGSHPAIALPLRDLTSVQKAADETILGAIEDGRHACIQSETFSEDGYYAAEGFARAFDADSEDEYLDGVPPLWAVGSNRMQGLLTRLH